MLMATIEAAMKFNRSRKYHMKQPCPFSDRILNEQCEPQNLASLLPVSFKTDKDPPTTPTTSDAICIKRELNLDRLNRIQHLLWIAGHPTPPRPLHQQLMLDREICISERMDLHLISTKKRNRIYMKPIPSFLLEPRFWHEYLSCEANCPYAIPSTTTTPVPDNSTGTAQALPQPPPSPCERHQLRKTALGFLFSYCSLIRHESDLALAKDRYLVPRHVEWVSWRLLVGEILATESLYEIMHQRFLYGELRLSRLTLIYFYTQGSRGMAGYMPQWTSYKDFVGDNCRWLATAVVYMALVLTAMQVGLSTTWLAGSEAFHRASYGFAVFSIVGPLAILLMTCNTVFLIYTRNVAGARNSFYSMMLRQRQVALEAV